MMYIRNCGLGALIILVNFRNGNDLCTFPNTKHYIYIISILIVIYGPILTETYHIAGLALSANDLESVQHYSINRLYPSVRKMYTTTSGLMPSTASAVNIKFATINHHHTTNGGSAIGSMSHSQSTGDVASIFGRAWPKVVGSLFGTSAALNKQHSEEAENEEGNWTWKMNHHWNLFRDTYI